MDAKGDNKKKIVAIVGMAGAGKTEAASVFLSSGWQAARFGQITLDEVVKRGWSVNEANERKIREEFRQKHGMAAYAILNLPKIDELLHTAPVAIDNVMSWSEYKVLKEQYGDAFKVIVIMASPAVRYKRLSSRDTRHGEDKEKKFRSFTPEESRSRDYSEIENLEKGGPMAMADFTIVNEGSLEAFKLEVYNLLARMIAE